MKMLYIETDKLKPNPDNIFPPLCEDEYQDLKASIIEHGIMEPLIVVQAGSNGSTSYTIYAGHNRLRAAQELSLPNLPCIVVTPDKAEAVMDTEIFRRMLTSDEKKQFTAMKKKKQREYIEGHLKKHLVPKTYEFYSNGQISLKQAVILAGMSDEEQSALCDVLYNMSEHVPDNSAIPAPHPEVSKKHAKEVADLTERHTTFRDQHEQLKESLRQKELEMKELREKHSKTYNLLMETTDELNTIKRSSKEEAAKALRGEVENRIKEVKEQLFQSSQAVKEKNIELENMRAECDAAKRSCEDAKGRINSAWVSAKIFRDECLARIRAIYSPAVISEHLATANRSLEFLNRYMADYPWDKQIIESTIAEMQSLRKRIDAIISALPKSKPRSLPEFPGMPREIVQKPEIVRLPEIIQLQDSAK